MSPALSSRPAPLFSYLPKRYSTFFQSLSQSFTLLSGSCSIPYVFCSITIVFHLYAYSQLWALTKLCIDSLAIHSLILSLCYSHTPSLHYTLTPLITPHSVTHLFLHSLKSWLPTSSLPHSLTPYFVMLYLCHSVSLGLYSLASSLPRHIISSLLYSLTNSQNGDFLVKLGFQFWKSCVRKYATKHQMINNMKI